VILKILGNDTEYKLEFKYSQEIKHLPRIGETIVLDLEDNKFKVVDIQTHISTGLNSASINEVYVYLESISYLR
jgi:hypothetical protein